MAAAFVVNLKATLEYRVNFILQFFGMMLNNAAFAAFWLVLINRTGAVGGYGFSDVMLVWALVSTSYGLAHIVFGNIRQVGRTIMEGGLDVYLLQPKDVWINLLSSRTIVSAWGDFAYGYIVLAMMTGTDLERLALFTALAIPAALIFAATFAAADSLAFFMGNASSCCHSRSIRKASTGRTCAGRCIPSYRRGLSRSCRSGCSSRWTGGLCRCCT